MVDSRSRLDQTLYYLVDRDGAVCAGRVRQGRCLLLFTSSATATHFADGDGIDSPAPAVFSRSRREFLTRARRSFGDGFIGGLIDPTTQPGETTFLGFDVDRRQGGPPPV
jgi:hypothetical protein